MKYDFTILCSFQKVKVRGKQVKNGGAKMVVIFTVTEMNNLVADLFHNLV